MEQSKNLRLARQAKAENNTEDAKLFYNKVREEEPENGEAKYFYAYYSMYEGKNKEIHRRKKKESNDMSKESQNWKTAWHNRKFWTWEPNR